MCLLQRKNRLFKFIKYKYGCSTFKMDQEWAQLLPSHSIPVGPNGLYCTSGPIQANYQAVQCKNLYLWQF